MKKVLPFIFPAIAFVVVLFLASRWYGMRSTRPGEISSGNENTVKIEELSEQDRSKVMMGVGDYQSVDMKVSDPDAMGEIRYEIVNGKVNMSVAAGFPMLEQGRYQVWFRDQASQKLQKAFVLEFSKGGFYGTAAVSAESLPLQVVVSREFQDDDQLEATLLEGEISAAAAEAQ